MLPGFSSRETHDEQDSQPLAVIQHLRDRTEGTGIGPMVNRTRDLRSKADPEVASSVCLHLQVGMQRPSNCTEFERK
jgi:hypothetical protein